MLVGGRLPWFWVRTCGWSPRTLTHLYTRRRKKKRPIHILLIAKLVPIHILFFIFYLFTYFMSGKRYHTDILSKWTLYPFIYLEAWKVYNIQPHVCIYLYNESLPPPPCAYPSWQLDPSLFAIAYAQLIVETSCLKLVAICPTFRGFFSILLKMTDYAFHYQMKATYRYVRLHGKVLAAWLRTWHLPY